MFLCLESVFPQSNTDSLIQDIRKKYQLILKNKPNFKINVEEYNWEADEVIPNLTDEQKEHEYNEMGNYIATKTSYSNKEKIIQLIEIEDETQKYQESYIRRRYREYCFYKGELFFYFEKKEEISRSEESKELVAEKRIYLNNGKIIRFLTKEIDGEGIFSINTSLDDVKNTSKAIELLEAKDYDLLQSYDYLYPEW